MIRKTWTAWYLPCTAKFSTSFLLSFNFFPFFLLNVFNCLWSQDSQTLMLGVPVISLPTGQRLTGVAVGSFPETDPIRSCSVRHVISQSRKLSSWDKSQMHFSPALVHLSCRIKKSWSPEPLPSSSIFILTGISEDQPQTTPPRKHMTMNPLEFKGHVVTTVFFSFFFFLKQAPAILKTEYHDQGHFYTTELDEKWILWVEL